MSETLDRLVDLLNLEQIELNIFRGRSPSDRRQRVFGGQVAGQALVAAGRTVPADRPVHFGEVFATLYHNLGIDVNKATVTDLSGRPQFLVEKGLQPMRELI